MAKRKSRIQHDEIVRRFGARLRELHLSRGMTQAELAERARVTVTYVGRLEAGGAAPGIDLVGRLAAALGTTVAELLPAEDPPDSLEVLRSRAERLFQVLLGKADRETLLMLNPLLARLAESVARNR